MKGRPKTQLGSCNFAGCERDKKSKGLCTAHYQQMKAGRPLAPLKTYVKSYKDENGRVCNTCGAYKAWEDYYAQRSSCKPCVSADNMARNYRNNQYKKEEAA